MNNTNLKELHTYLVEYYNRSLGLNEDCIFEDYKYTVEQDNQGNDLVVASEYLISDRVDPILVPDVFDKIGNSCFYKLELLTEITMGKNIVEIGENIVEKCKSLESINFNPKLKKIGIIYIDSDMDYLDIPDSVESVSGVYMANLTPTISFGENVKKFDLKNVSVNSILEFHSNELVLNGLFTTRSLKVYFKGRDMTKILEKCNTSVELNYVNRRIFYG